MKVLFIRTLNPLFESSASANRYEGIIRGLLDRGVHVILVVTGGYSNPDELRQKKKTIAGYKNLTVKYLFPTFNHNIWLRRINVYLLSGFRQLIVNLRLKPLLKADYDFVWVTFDRTILRTFNKNHAYIKGKSIIELNEYNDLHEGHVKFGNKLQQRNAGRENVAFIEALKRIDLVLVMTQKLISHYKQMSKPDAEFLHLPMTVDMKRFVTNEFQQSDYDIPYIAYTGTLNNYKDGVDVLINAFIKISAKYPAYKLYIAGFYHYDYEEHKILIRESGLNDRIIYLGLLDKSMIPQFIQNASLLVMARPDSRQAQGGFPTKLGEYLATGNPVCVTRVGEIPQYLDDNVSAFMADPGSVVSFADAMERALTDQENAQRVGQAGKLVALDNFNVEVQCNRLLNFLEKNI